jgi:hypothetical protein
VSSGTRQVGNLRSIGSPYVGKSKQRPLLETLCKRAGELLILSRNWLRILTGLLTGHYHVKGHLLKPVLVKSPECDGCKQASEMATHILCDCEALATLCYRYLGRHFMKPGDFEDICVSKILHFAQGAGLLNE